VLLFRAGLPDCPWYSIPKWINRPNVHKFYQNVHKLYQMSAKYTKHLNQDFWYANTPSGNPDLVAKWLLSM
jgi:hypothetical protein